MPCSQSVAYTPKSHAAYPPPSRQPQSDCFFPRERENEGERVPRPFKLDIIACANYAAQWPVLRHMFIIESDIN